MPENTFPRPQPSGTLFGTIDFAPHSKTALHRTLSLDYCAVISGSIWLSLDGGAETEIKAGEAVGRRRTSHVWENREDGWCRAVFVLVGSEKVNLPDWRELEGTKRGSPKLYREWDV